jgi:hypothetical protein
MAFCRRFCVSTRIEGLHLVSVSFTSNGAVDTLSRDLPRYRRMVPTLRSWLLKIELAIE